MARYMVLNNKMKRFILYIIVLSTNLSIGQHINYKDDSGWNLGLNIGGSWQTTEKYFNDNDTAFNSPFAGYTRGFTFGKSLYEKENKIFSFDLRFRYLKGENSGWAALADSFADPNGYYSSINTGLNDDSIYSYHNYQMKFNEYTLEGVLTLNKLREKTGWILYGFGGVGLTFYNVNRDILDGTSNSIFDEGSPYDYSILTFESDIKTARQLKDLSDGHFETEIEKNKLKFMPSLGFGIGYQFKKHWSIGIEHKITYALNSNINGVKNSVLNDKYYYTALKINFNIIGAESSSSSTIKDSQKNQNNSLRPSPVSQERAPVVERLNPSNNYSTYNFPTINFSNSILNLSGNELINVESISNDFSTRNDIEFTINGLSNNNYSFKNNVLYSTINLIPGTNIIKVKGTNEYGSDLKTTTINYDPQSIPNPPSVNITVPSNSTLTTNSPYCSVHATILNIDNQSEITYEINGERVYNFSFNGRNFSSNNIPLINGYNIIRISASNIYGLANDEVVINYTPEIPTPNVDITFPYDNPYESKNSTTLLRATIKNIKDKYDIEFYINGFKSYNFNYQNTQFESQNINLISGRNTFRIIGKNNSGTDEDQTIIYYNKSLSPRPIVNITNPQENPAVSSNKNVNIYASIFNVLDKNDILFYVNNIKKTVFQFSGNSFQANNVMLKEGKNYIKIAAANDQGTVYDETIIIYKPLEGPKPLVSFTKPNVPTSASKSRYVSLKANILNVKGTNNVIFSVNGRFLTNFNFSGNTFTAANIALENGENNIVLKGQNNQGNASDKITIIYQPVVVEKPVITNPLIAKPIVNITKPKESPFITSSVNTNITATVLNVKYKGDISFILNGVKLNSFQFSGNSFQANNVMLKEGKNIIVIKGENSAGSASDEAIIEYTREVIPGKVPEISFTYPSYSPFNTNNKMILLKGKIFHVEEINDVTITMNGVSVKNFLFDPYFDDFECEIQLQNGNNIFKVTASNNNGKDEKLTTIIFASEECENPVIQLNSPSTNNLTVNSSRAFISASIVNTQNVTFVIDGTSSQGYNFDVNNGAFSSMINLTPGSHTYEISAFNSCGSISEIITFNYVSNTNGETEDDETLKEKEMKKEEEKVIELKRKKAIEETRQRNLIQQQQKAEEDKQRKLQLQQQQKAEEDRQRKLQLQQQQKAEEDRQRKLQLQQQQKAEEDRQRKLQLQQQQKVEEEKQRRLQLQQQQKAEEEKQRKLQLQQQQKAEEDRQRRLQLQQQQKAEEEKQRKLQLQQQQKAEEDKQRKLQLQQQQKAEEDKQRKLQLQQQQKAEEDKQRKKEAEAERKKEENNKSSSKKGGGK